MRVFLFTSVGWAVSTISHFCVMSRSNILWGSTASCDGSSPRSSISIVPHMLSSTMGSGPTFPVVDDDDDGPSSLPFMVRTSLIL